MYEVRYTGERFMPLLPVLARVDGKNFHTFCKGLERPYDVRLQSLLIEVTKYLVEETNALLGYTQSDEISLVMYSGVSGSGIYYDGRVQKIVGDLAAATSVQFNRLLRQWYIREKDYSYPRFDARAWQVPTLEEAANYFLWREQDCTKNSISMAARHYYSHRELCNKCGVEMQDMLHEKGVNWNDYPPTFKRGTYVRREKVVRKFTTEELEKLPLRHEARTNPDLEIERSRIRVVSMPRFGSVVNRVGVIFYGEEPQVKEE